MATIRPQQIGAVDYSGSNNLLARAQQMLTGGIGGIGASLADFRNSVVANNTAQALGLITGAQNPEDLAKRQQAVASLIQQSGGDIDAGALAKAQSTMPDTLLNRQRGQLALTQANTQMHDQPLLNQAMARYAAGDSKGASDILSGVQGDASDVLKFGSDIGFKNQSLALQRAGLAQRQAAAAARAGQARAQTSQLLNVIKGMYGADASAQNADTKAAVDYENRLSRDAESANPLNNPKNDVNSTVNKLNTDNNKWYLPDSDRGTKLQSLVKQLDPNGTLNAQQQNNLLSVMNDAYGSADSLFGSTNPEDAALTRGKEAIDSLKNAQKSQLSATKTGIEAKRATQMQQQQLLLNLLMRGGLSNPLSQSLPTDDEDD